MDNLIYNIRTSNTENKVDKNKNRDWGIERIREDKTRAWHEMRGIKRRLGSGSGIELRNWVRYVRRRQQHESEPEPGLAVRQGKRLICNLALNLLLCLLTQVDIINNEEKEEVRC